MSSDSQKPLLVYLGPPGTYSHQAAYERFGDAVEYTPCERIKDIYTYTASSTSSPSLPRQTLHLLPLENSKNGIVLETLDLLLQPTSSISSPQDGRLIIREELRTGVRHCLIVSGRKGKEASDLEGITWVKSHEQALAQCQKFLSTHLPNAKRIPVPSTAHAAVSLLPSDAPSTNGEVAEGVRGAAICSRVVTDIYPGLECASEGIEDKTGNTTRFLVLSSSSLSPSIPSQEVRPASTSPSHLTALSFPSLPPTSLSTILSPSLVSLDRRPAQGGENETDGGGFRSGWLAVYQTSGPGGADGEWWTDASEVARVGGISLGIWSARD